MQAEAEPKLDWAHHTFRVRMMTDNQVRALRKRQLIESFKLHKYMLKQNESPDSELFKLTTRDGAYWGIRTNINHYDLAHTLDCPIDKTTELGSIQTRLKRLDSKAQECLINWIMLSVMLQCASTSIQIFQHLQVSHTILGWVEF